MAGPEISRRHLFGLAGGAIAAAALGPAAASKAFAVGPGYHIGFDPSGAPDQSVILMYGQSSMDIVMIHGASNSEGADIVPLYWGRSRHRLNLPTAGSYRAYPLG